MQSSPAKLNKKKFMQEYEKCKEFVDNGITDYFILSDNAAFGNISQIGNTTLSDISDIFGKDYIYMFRFACYYPCRNFKFPQECYQTFRIRPLLKKDRKFLRNDYKFFPQNCWVCETKDGGGSGAVFLFTQKQNGEVNFLVDNPIYRKNLKHSEIGCLKNTQWEIQVKKIIETIPDYFESLFAITKYKGVDMIIPMPYESVTRTFKDREKDEKGIKRHLVHSVRDYERKNLVTSDCVHSHLRGRSELIVDGIKVTLMASYDWSKRYYNNT